MSNCMKRREDTGRKGRKEGKRRRGKGESRRIKETEESEGCQTV